MNALEQVITVSEAADILNVSDRHVRRQCQAGILTARKDYKGTWLILKSSTNKPQIADEVKGD